MRERDYLQKELNKWLKKALKSECAQNLRFYQNLPEEFCRKGDCREPSAHCYFQTIDEKFGIAGVEVCHYYMCVDGNYEDGEQRFRECTYSVLFPFFEETRKLREIQDAAQKGAGV